MPINLAPREFNPNAIDLDARLGSVRKEHIDPGMFPFDWFEFESPPTGSPRYDKHRLKLKDFAVLQAVLEGRAFVGLDCAEDVDALDVLALDAAGDVVKAGKGAANTSNVIGFAATTTSSGDKVRVITGGVLDGFVGLTINELLYLHTDGDYTQNVATLGTGEYVVILGVAVSATEVEISLGQPLLWDQYNAVTYIEDQDGYTAAGGVKVPTVPTISVCEAVATKAIRIVWDAQRNLTNVDRYELQVSDDDATWYSLEVDGSDWKDTLNADTDHDVETYIHQGIPHGGAATAPTGVTLYYQVRRVTKAPVASAWSASASATTNTVAAGDLAANSIYVNNLLAATVETMLLRSAAIYVGYDGTGSWDDPDAGDRRVYIDDDELKIQRYSGAAWVDRIHLGYQVMRAKDENAVVIHDIPDTAVLADMVYGGHAMWKDAPNYIDDDSTLSFTDTETDRAATACTTQNVDISALVGGLTNVKGALVTADVAVRLAANKTLVGTDIRVEMRYSTAYNTAPVLHNRMIVVDLKSQVAGQILYQEQMGQAMIPVVWDSGTPYITWNVVGVWNNMDNNNGNYFVVGTLYLLGFFV